MRSRNDSTLRTALAPAVGQSREDDARASFRQTTGAVVQWDSGELVSELGSDESNVAVVVCRLRQRLDVAHHVPPSQDSCSAEARSWLPGCWHGAASVRRCLRPKRHFVYAPDLAVAAALVLAVVAVVYLTMSHPKH